MFIDDYREVITESTHDIPRRLREIDTDYFIVRNHKTNEFEVHHKGQIGNSLALNIPFKELDERTIDLVKSTSIQYSQNIINEMERNNEKLETDKIKKRNEMGQEICKDIHKYVTRHEDKETIDSDIL